MILVILLVAIYRMTNHVASCTILFSEVGLHNYSEFTCPLRFWKNMAGQAGLAWLMKGNFTLPLLQDWIALPEVKPSFTVKMVKCSHNKWFLPRQIVLVSSKSALQWVWVPFHFIFLINIIWNNRWSSTWMPWREKWVLFKWPQQTADACLP